MVLPGAVTVIVITCSPVRIELGTVTHTV
jgi:hypothetical protein